MRYPDFAKFWWGALISNCGTWMQHVTVPYVLYQQTGSATLVGLAGFCQFIPALFVASVGGWLADRHSRRSLLLVTHIGLAVHATVLWGLYAAGHRGAALLIGLVFIGGIFQGLVVPPWQAFVTDLVPRHAFLNAVTLNSAQFHASRAIGPALAGVVLARLGPDWAFALNAVSFASVIVALAVITPVSPVATEHAGGPLAQLRESLRYVREIRGILVAISLAGVGAALGQPLFQLMPVLAEEVFDADAWRYGLMTASLGAGGVLGAVVLGALGGRSRASMARTNFAAYALGLAVVGLAPTYVACIIALVVIGALYLMIVAQLNTSVQLQVPDHRRGGVMAVYVMTFHLAYPLGALAQGALAETIGPRATVVVCGVGVAVAVAVAHARDAFRSLDDERPDAVDVVPTDETVLIEP